MSTQTITPSALDLKNVQGDILLGLPKKTQTFSFFRIDDKHVTDFRTQLLHLLPLITSTTDTAGHRESITKHKRNKDAGLLPITGVNIAFSSRGLQKLGIVDQKNTIGDTVFDAGMLADAEHLGDKGTKTKNGFKPDWEFAFTQEIDGVFLVTGDSHQNVERQLTSVKSIFSGKGGVTIHELISLKGDVRPGKESGHEHFGFMDGISQPAVQGVDQNPPPQGPQGPIPQGNILLGREGDAQQAIRPTWALDGSFLVFRLLPQRVPEFDQFLVENALKVNDPTVSGRELLGARLVGRWKSGAPVDVTPLKDDQALAADAVKVNDFSYDPLSQERCPFAAHTRKTNPRADLVVNGVTGAGVHRIIRRGIPFGPEVCHEEAASKQTKHQRGLLFVSYQSSIADGFQFIQKSWANFTGFPIGKPKDQTPGFDPIIGQTSDLSIRSMSGATPGNPTGTLSLTQEWVESKGGEYFFSPSISALKDTFAAHAR